ncbi:helix-turn-helix domain-containing protein [Chryseobacterium sp. MIQD13]|uniref:helix-turn-helix domain-containing protein n=1 Tax=Chryseobacterium sp. MIQD13 TaxID=3422310 RepID=UPI003D29202F
MNHPDYNKIYIDLIERKFPEKREEFTYLLSKKIKNSLELIRINSAIFDCPDKGNVFFNQRLRSYDKVSIKKILEYQETHRLNNQEAAKLFNVSRNTIGKWKKRFGMTMMNWE